MFRCLFLFYVFVAFLEIYFMSIKSIYLCLVVDTSELFTSSDTREDFLEQVAVMKLQHVMRI